MGSGIIINGNAPSRIFGQGCNLGSFYTEAQLQRQIEFYPELDRLGQYVKQLDCPDAALRDAEITISGTVQKAGMRATFERLFRNVASHGIIVDGPNNLNDGRVHVKLRVAPLEIIATNFLFCPGRGYHLIAGTKQDADTRKTIISERGEKVPKKAGVIWTSHIEKVEWKIMGLTPEEGAIDLATFIENNRWLPNRFDLSEVITGIRRDIKPFTFPGISDHQHLEGMEYTEWGDIPVFHGDGSLSIEHRIEALKGHYESIYGKRMSGPKKKE